MKLYRDLFWAFFKIGGLTFGGGYAMFPIMKKELIEKFGWITEEELLDYYAIGQCTPGIIAVNTATFVGNKLKGVRGAMASTFGMVLPSLIIITIIASFIKNFAEITYVQYAFAGIRLVVLVLIFDTVFSLWKKGVKDVFGVGIFILVIFASFIPFANSITTVIVCGVLGIFYYKTKGGATK